MLSLHDHIHSRANQLSCLNQLSNEVFSLSAYSLTSKTQLFSLLSNIKKTEISRKEREDNLLGFAFYQKDDGFQELKLIMQELMPLDQCKQIKCSTPLQTFKQFLKILGLQSRYEGIIKGINANQLNYVYFLKFCFFIIYQNSCYIIMFKLLVDLQRKQLAEVIKDVYQKFNTINNKDTDQLLKNIQNEQNVLNAFLTPRISLEIQTSQQKNRQQPEIIKRLQSAQAQTYIQQFQLNVKQENSKQLKYYAGRVSLQTKKVLGESQEEPSTKQNQKLKNCKNYFRMLSEIISDLEFSSFSMIFNIIFNIQPWKIHSIKETQLFKHSLQRNSLISKKVEVFQHNFDKARFKYQAQKFLKKPQESNQIVITQPERVKINKLNLKNNYQNICRSQISNFITKRKTTPKLTILQPSQQKSLDNNKLKLPQKSYFVKNQKPKRQINQECIPCKLNYLDFPLKEKEVSMNQFSKLTSNNSNSSIQEQQLNSRLKMQYQAYLNQKKVGLHVISNEIPVKSSQQNNDRQFQSCPYNLKSKLITLPLQIKENKNTLLKEELKPFFVKVSIATKSLYKALTPKNYNSDFNSIFLIEPKSAQVKTCKFNRIQTALKRNYLI